GGAGGGGGGRGGRRGGRAGGGGGAARPPATACAPAGAAGGRGSRGAGAAQARQVHAEHLLSGARHQRPAQLDVKHAGRKRRQTPGADLIGSASAPVHFEDPVSSLSTRPVVRAFSGLVAHRPTRSKHNVFVRLGVC